MIYKLWRQRIVKQDESDGDPKFIMTIKVRCKLTSYWKSDRRQSWKWRGIYKAYRNPILKFDVGQTSDENTGKA